MLHLTKIVTGLFILASTGVAFSQPKLSLSLQLAPTYAHGDSRVIFPFPDQATQLPTTELISVSNGLTYSVGVAARYGLTAKWSVSTGLWATHTVLTKADYSQNGIQFTIRYQYNHPFTNLYRAPLLIHYQSSTKRLSPYFSIGATFDFRGITYVDLSGNGELIPVKFGKALVVTPLVGAGLRYSLNKHLSLIAQPTLQYSVDPHPTYSYFHFYQLSLQTQLMYSF